MPPRGYGRDRSRSPKEIPRRSRSPPRRQHHHQSTDHTSNHTSSHKRRTSVQQELPFHASPIMKRDYGKYKPMFALYLDIQKQLDLGQLSEREGMGRWKSFVGKWNHGELAEGWYDPATLQKAQSSQSETTKVLSQETETRTHDPGKPDRTRDDDTSSEESDVGPSLPIDWAQGRSGKTRSGPTVPRTQDLELKREYEDEAQAAAREDLRYARNLDRKLQKEQMEEIAPRAEAGTKDRMLEKKREKADSNRAFATAKTEGGGMDDVAESDLYGGNDGGIEGFKKQKKEQERRKNERELRKEEILRARREEREERIQEYRAREARTMSGLVALAQARFGPHHAHE